MKNAHELEFETRRDSAILDRPRSNLLRLGDEEVMYQVVVQIFANLGIGKGEKPRLDYDHVRQLTLFEQQ